MAIVWKTNQLVFGTIVALYPQKKRARIRIQNQQLIAYMDAELVVGKSYWFQLTKPAPALTLRLLQTKPTIAAVAAYFCINEWLLNVYYTSQSPISHSLIRDLFTLKKQLNMTSTSFKTIVNQCVKEWNLSLTDEHVLWIHTIQQQALTPETIAQQLNQFPECADMIKGGALRTQPSLTTVQAAYTCLKNHHWDTSSDHFKKSMFAYVALKQKQMTQKMSLDFRI
ncbi:hypothetical protein [Shouchella miscanthi]|uniref:hypothetical protein n=1 Tax=Shouchella miscanthi TaxID=2598861 RepID=UPI0011A04685|nr:hypothetical protein [Shouchella miscanthi]